LLVPTHIHKGRTASRAHDGELGRAVDDNLLYFPRSAESTVCPLCLELRRATLEIEGDIRGLLGASETGPGTINEQQVSIDALWLRFQDLIEAETFLTDHVANIHKRRRLRTWSGARQRRSRPTWRSDLHTHRSAPKQATNAI